MASISDCVNPPGAYNAEVTTAPIYKKITTMFNLNLVQTLRIGPRCGHSLRMRRIIGSSPSRLAFGTGQHASTRGALTLMRQALGALPPEVEQRALDVGTGTGILAMAAALWGMPAVLALDNDPEAVQVAAENVARNGLAAQIRVALTPLAALSGSFALVTANIVHDVLAAMQADLTRLTAQGGFLLLAGILAGGQEANIVRLYGDCGFHLVEARYEDEWAVLFLRRG